jgi:FkbH-like protein
MSDPAPGGFPWRPPLDPGWADDLAGLTSGLKTLADLDPGAATAFAHAARRLANQRLGPLEQLRLNRLAARLWPHRDQLSALRPVRIALLSNRMVGLLAPEIRGAGLARGLLVDFVESEFDTAEAVASGGLALEDAEGLDATVLLLDGAAFFASGPRLGRAAEDQALDAARQRLARLVEGLRRRLRAPVIVATSMAWPERTISSADPAMPGSPHRLVRRFNDAIAAGAEADDWLIWDLEELATEVGSAAWCDPARFHQGKLPFAAEQGPLAADHLCRILAAMTGRSGRALVLDLDNTLWGGVIGDDGVEGIRLGQGSPEGEAFLAIQQLALDLRQRGVVLAVCSKNDDAVARRAFTEHADMLLKLEHIAVFQANWSDKASNLKAIAQTLNLGLGSLVFVDDNPAERARVRQELPEVLVPELGEDPAWYPRMIVASGVFETLVLGAEDLGRADAYQANAERAELRETVGNYQDYLRSLRMTMTIAPFDRLGRARIAQLIAKSNQFNLTTRRYGEVEVAALEADPAVVARQVRLTDAFSDHGMIAVIIVRAPEGPVWTIDSWLMSCRVLERGVEQALMNRLVAQAQAAGCRELRGLYRPTDRNRIVADFYDRMGFPLIAEEASGERTYALELDGFEPFEVQIEVK